ncbi:MAG: ScpA/B protein [Acetothermia bacterium 64_32]|nr:MAG: ScpA/B protein [Acetothermia bacterium 64_32]
MELEALARADWDLLFSRLARDMDPWAVDLVELVSRFRGYLALLQGLELEVPGRMLHAGAVLLRMKSEWIRDQDRRPVALEQVVREVEEAPVAEEVYIAPELRLPLLRRPKARASLAELRRALKCALLHGERREQGQKKPSPNELGLRISKEPFSRRTKRLLRKLLSLINGSRIIPFSALLSKRDPREKVATFMELLHLDTEGKVRLVQEEFLGELLIEVGDGAEGVD